MPGQVHRKSSHSHWWLVREEVKTGCDQGSLDETWTIRATENYGPSRGFPPSDPHPSDSCCRTSFTLANIQIIDEFFFFFLFGRLRKWIFLQWLMLISKILEYQRFCGQMFSHGTKQAERAFYWVKKDNYGESQGEGLEVCDASDIFKSVTWSILLLPH